jgi:four helix bundle suffix protein
MIRALKQLEHFPMSNRTYETYKSYTADAESSANVAICLIHQANYLLDKQIQSLEKQFVEEGGYTEQLFKKRMDYKNKRS